MSYKLSGLNYYQFDIKTTLLKNFLSLCSDLDFNNYSMLEINNNNMLCVKDRRLNYFVYIRTMEWSLVKCKHSKYRHTSTIILCTIL